MSERTLKHIIECVVAMKDVLGDDVAWRWDWAGNDGAGRHAASPAALEPHNIMWLEDMIPATTSPTSTPMSPRGDPRLLTPFHTGEQIYWAELQQLIEATRSTSSARPLRRRRPRGTEMDAEYADLHGIFWMGRFSSIVLRRMCSCLCVLSSLWSSVVFCSVLLILFLLCTLLFFSLLSDVLFCLLFSLYLILVAGHPRRPSPIRR